MTIDHVLAVVAVSDLDTASRWYAELFARKPDNNPMPSLVEWQVADHAWVQVFVDADRAGKGLLNFAVSDLVAEVAALTARGLAPGAIVDANKGVQTCELTDPDGNTISLIGGFRVEY